MDSWTKCNAMQYNAMPVSIRSYDQTPFCHEQERVAGKTQPAVPLRELAMWLCAPVVGTRLGGETNEALARLGLPSVLSSLPPAASIWPCARRVDASVAGIESRCNTTHQYFHSAMMVAIPCKATLPRQRCAMLRSGRALETISARGAGWDFFIQSGGFRTNGYGVVVKRESEHGSGRVWVHMILTRFGKATRFEPFTRNDSFQFGLLATQPRDLQRRWCSSICEIAAANAAEPSLRARAGGHVQRPSPCWRCAAAAAMGLIQDGGVSLSLIRVQKDSVIRKHGRWASISKRRRSPPRV